MSAVSAIAGLLLGGAFVLAGASKLAAGGSWPTQARDLGAPAIVVTPLPWVEMSVGALLIVQVFAVVAAVAAITMLLAFSIMIVARLREGRRPPCACFGAWSATPIGPRHLVRNAALAALGVLAMLG